MCALIHFAFAHNESQEARVHKSHMDGQWSGASKPCTAPPLQHDSTVRHTTICAVCFEICKENAILLPGRIPGYRRDDIQLLPSSTTKHNIWELYHRTASESEGARAVCYSLFCRLWQQLIPQVVVTKPMSDLCWTFQQNSTLIMRAHN